MWFLKKIANSGLYVFQFFAYMGGVKIEAFVFLTHFLTEYNLYLWNLNTEYNLYLCQEVKHFLVLF